MQGYYDWIIFDGRMDIVHSSPEGLQRDDTSMCHVFIKQTFHPEYKKNSVKTSVKQKKLRFLFFLLSNL